MAIVYSIYIDLCLYVLRHIMCSDLVRGRGRLVKVFSGRGAVNRLFQEYSLKTRKEQGRGCYIQIT